MTTAKKYKIKKLDRRMTGYETFSHRIEFYWDEDFLKIRNWCFDSFGPACELEFFNLNTQLGLGYTWAWRSDHYRRDLYLNQEQLSAFVMFNT